MAVETFGAIRRTSELVEISHLIFRIFQLSHSAPTPEEEKKDAGVAPAAAAAAEPASQPVAVAKAETPEAAASPVDPAPHAEEKKA
ncbi:jg14463 [Pararge aegeria aegeria]|uniref:Jg14463 protein n=1 Tax=Pararge aegeria aegeria TaxID=348720 RepID=A0A8S4RZZ0_9NEOP|nr:jg14463 [Pararge aegeria aegeria]